MKKIAVIVCLISAFASCGGSSGSTTADSVVSSMAYSIIKTVTEGSTTLTFNFSAAVPADRTPSVNVTDQGGTAATVSSCAFNDGRTVYTCTASGLAGCGTFTDYAVSLSGTGFTSFSSRFNSADDDFSDEATIGTCWTTSGSGSYTVTGGSINFSFTGSESSVESKYMRFMKEPNNSADIAYAGLISENNTPSNPTAADGCTTWISFRDSLSHEFGYGGGVFYASWVPEYLTTWILSATTADGFTWAVAKTGTTFDLAPIYVCFSRVSGTYRTYLSEDGTNWSRIDDSQIECSTIPAANCDADKISQLIAFDPGFTDSFATVEGKGQCGAAYTSKVGGVLYKSGTLAGTAADCPTF